MSWKIWKKPVERGREEFEKAYVEGVNQKNWDSAVNHFMKAAKLLAQSNDPSDRQKALEAEALASLYNAVKNSTPENWLKCSNLMSKLGDLKLNIPYEASAKDVANEALIRSKEVYLSMERSKLSREDYEKMEELAKGYEELAKEYFKLEGVEPALNDLLEERDLPLVKGQKLLGLASMIRGEMSELKDPAKAAEYYSQSLGYFSSIVSDEGEKLRAKVEKISKVAKCWFCGREIQGEEIHFFYMDTILTPYIKSRYGDETPKSLEDGRIVACKTCYESIRIAADRIAKSYYDMALKEIAKLREEMLKEFKGLSESLAMLNRRISTLNTEIMRLKSERSKPTYRSRNIVK